MAKQKKKDKKIQDQAKAVTKSQSSEELSKQSLPDENQNSTEHSDQHQQAVADVGQHDASLNEPIHQGQTQVVADVKGGFWRTGKRRTLVIWDKKLYLYKMQVIEKNIPINYLSEIILKDKITKRTMKPKLIFDTPGTPTLKITFDTSFERGFLTEALQAEGAKILGLDSINIYKKYMDNRAKKNNEKEETCRNSDITSELVKPASENGFINDNSILKTENWQSNSDPSHLSKTVSFKNPLYSEDTNKSSRECFPGNDEFYDMLEGGSGINNIEVKNIVANDIDTNLQISMSMDQEISLDDPKEKDGSKLVFPNLENVIADGSNEAVNSFSSASANRVNADSETTEFNQTTKDEKFDVKDKETNGATINNSLTEFSEGHISSSDVQQNIGDERKLTEVKMDDYSLVSPSNDSTFDNGIPNSEKNSNEETSSMKENCLDQHNTMSSTSISSSINSLQDNLCSNDVSLNSKAKLTDHPNKIFDQCEENANQVIKNTIELENVCSIETTNAKNENLREDDSLDSEQNASELAPTVALASDLNLHSSLSETKEEISSVEFNSQYSAISSKDCNDSSDEAEISRDVFVQSKDNQKGEILDPENLISQFVSKVEQFAITKTNTTETLNNWAEIDCDDLESSPIPKIINEHSTDTILEVSDTEIIDLIHINDAPDEIVHIEKIALKDPNNIHFSPETQSTFRDVIDANPENNGKLDVTMDGETDNDILDTTANDIYLTDNNDLEYEDELGTHCEIADPSKNIDEKKRNGNDYETVESNQFIKKPKKNVRFNDAIEKREFVSHRISESSESTVEHDKDNISINEEDEEVENDQNDEQHSEETIYGPENNKTDLLESLQTLSFDFDNFDISFDKSGKKDDQAKISENLSMSTFEKKNDEEVTIVSISTLAPSEPQDRREPLQETISAATNNNKRRTSKNEAKGPSFIEIDESKKGASMVDVTGDGRLYSKRQVAVRAGSLLVYIEPKTKIRDSQAKLVHTMSLERVSVLPAVRVSQDGLFKLELKQVSGKKLNLQFLSRDDQMRFALMISDEVIKVTDPNHLYGLQLYPTKIKESDTKALPTIKQSDEIGSQEKNTIIRDEKIIAAGVGDGIAESKHAPIDRDKEHSGSNADYVNATTGDNIRNFLMHKTTFLNKQDSIFLKPNLKQNSSSSNFSINSEMLIPGNKKVVPSDKASQQTSLTEIQEQSHHSQNNETENLPPLWQGSSNGDKLEKISNASKLDDTLQNQSSQDNSLSRQNIGVSNTFSDLLDELEVDDNSILIDENSVSELEQEICIDNVSTTSDLQNESDQLMRNSITAIAVTNNLISNYNGKIHERETSSDTNEAFEVLSRLRPVSSEVVSLPNNDTSQCETHPWSEGKPSSVVAQRGNKVKDELKKQAAIELNQQLSMRRFVMDSRMREARLRDQRDQLERRARAIIHTAPDDEADLGNLAVFHNLAQLYEELAVVKRHLKDEKRRTKQTRQLLKAY